MEDDITRFLTRKGFICVSGSEWECEEGDIKIEIVNENLLKDALFFSKNNKNFCECGNKFIYDDEKRNGVCRNCR